MLSESMRSFVDNWLVFVLMAHIVAVTWVDLSNSGEDDIDDRSWLAGIVTVLLGLMYGILIFRDDYTEPKALLGAALGITSLVINATMVPDQTARGMLYITSGIMTLPAFGMLFTRVGRRR